MTLEEFLRSRGSTVSLDVTPRIDRFGAEMFYLPEFVEALESVATDFPFQERALCEAATGHMIKAVDYLIVVYLTGDQKKAMASMLGVSRQALHKHETTKAEALAELRPAFDEWMRNALDPTSGDIRSRVARLRTMAKSEPEIASALGEQIRRVVAAGQGFDPVTDQDADK